MRDTSADASGDAAPLPVVAFDEIDSTNLEAMRRADAGEHGPIWLTARRQTRGKGRSGRAWDSPDGNLYATLLVTIAAPLATAPQLSLLAGVIAIDAIRSLAGRSAPSELRLKWPNDVLVGDAKMAGILVECTKVAPTPADTSGAPCYAAVLGWGINLRAHPALPDRATTDLSRHGIDTAPAAMLASLDGQARRWLDAWGSGRQFDVIRAAWLQRAVKAGEQLTVKADGGPVSGRFHDLDDDGALLLTLADGQMRRFTFGDVTLSGATRPATDSA